MYEPHPKLSLPALETVIWRYVDLAKLVSMLDSRGLFFASVRSLAEQDRWEAAFPKRWKEAWLRELGRQGMPHDQSADSIFSHSQRYLLDRAFLNCWHISNGESDAMWKVYSNGSNNVAIRSTVGRLCESFGRLADRIHVGQVDYIDHRQFDPTIDDRILNIMPALVWKREAFAHEKELRAIRIVEGTTPPPPTTLGLTINVDLNLLLQELRISPRSPIWFRDLVRRIADKYGFADLPVERSTLDDDPGTA
jgi:hypothetical protein